jgi:hypothetical protein
MTGRTTGWFIRKNALEMLFRWQKKGICCVILVENFLVGSQLEDRTGGRIIRL